MEDIKIQEQEDPNVTEFNNKLSQILGTEREAEGIHCAVDKGG